MPVALNFRLAYLLVVLAATLTASKETEVAAEDSSVLFAIKSSVMTENPYDFYEHSQKEQRGPAIGANNSKGALQTCSKSSQLLSRRTWSIIDLVPRDNRSELCHVEETAGELSPMSNQTDEGSRNVTSSVARIEQGLYVEEIADSTSAVLAVAPRWLLKRGPCIVKGRCVTSPNYFDGKYGNDEECEIGFEGKGVISDKEVEFDFDTEEDADVLTMGGRAFSGSRPLGLRGMEASDIHWSSNSAYTRYGWRLCLTVDGDLFPRDNRSELLNVEETAGELSPRSNQTGEGSRNDMIEQGLYAEEIADSTSSSVLAVAPRWILKRGPCIVKGRCVTSPNYFDGKYGNDEECEIGFEGKGVISDKEVEFDFDTEEDADVLTMGGRAFSGSRPLGLRGLEASDIHWSSNSAHTRYGWRLCLKNDV